MNKRKVILIILAIAVLTTITGCQAWRRGVKDFSSSVTGLKRTASVYSHNGDLINTYKGKFDISENGDGTKVKFDLDGKRIMIYNAIVIVEEE